MRPSRAAAFVLFSALAWFGIAAAQEQDTWTVNLDGADLNDFVQEVATITGKTIIVDERLRGTITIASTKAYTKDEIYEIFLATLRVHNYGIVESNEVVRILPTQNLRTFGVARNLGEGEASSEQMISRIFHLEYVDPLEVAKVLRLIGPQYSHVAAIQNTNALIVTDHADNVAAIAQLLTTIDVETDVTTVNVPLEHAYVGDVVDMLTEILPARLFERADGLGISLTSNTRTNALVVIGHTRDVTRTLELVRMFDVPPTSEGTIKVIPLSYASAEPAADIVRVILSEDNQGSTDAAERFAIVHDESLNALVVRADPAEMTRIEKLVTELDVPRRQVLIEAAIVEVTLDNTTAVGVELGVADNDSSSLPAATTSLTGILSTMLNSLEVSGADVSEVEASDLLGNFGSPTLAIARLDPDRISFGAIVHALETNTQTNLLSTPHVMGVDHEQSSIFHGSNVPFRSGNLIFPNDQVNFPSTRNQRQDVGIRLEVTPHIHEDLSVRMEITQSVDEVATPDLGIGDTGFADIVVLKREITTTVVAENEHTIVLGGLIREETRKVQRQVPGLGKLPLFGRLFRSSSDTDVTSHLMVFLRPTVVTNATQSDAEAARRYNSITSTKLKASGSTDESSIPPLEDLFKGSTD